MDITERLKSLGYEKSGSFCRGHITGTKDFGSVGGHTVFTILLDTPLGDEVANVRSFPNGKDLNNWQVNPTVAEMELALEVIYSYREWKKDCPKCMSFDKEDFVCRSCIERGIKNV